MSAPVALVEIRATSHGLVANLRDARAKFGQWAEGVNGDMAKKFAKPLSTQARAVGTALGNLGSSALSKGAGFMEDMAKQSFSFDEKLKRLQITAEATPATMDEFKRTVRAASDETGLSRDSILDAASAYVALTGDMDTARASTVTWAKVAQATNTSVADIASTAAAMSQQMKIGPAEMEASFAALAIQGKKGAIELKDLAGYLNVIAPQWAMFNNGTGAQGVRELGAALQIVKRGFGGDAGETVTGLQSLLTAITKNSAKFKNAGIKIFDVDAHGNKHMRDVLDIVDAIGHSKLMKDPTALEKSFGRVEAYRAFLQLQQNKGALDDLIKASSDAGVIQRDLTTYMDSSAGRTRQSWERLENKIADVFTPKRLEAFANAMDALADKGERIAHEIEGIGIAFQGFVGVGESIRGALGGNDARTYSTKDIMTINYGGYEIGGDNSDAARARRVKIARSNQAGVDESNKAAQYIMAGESNGKSTDESLRRAYLAKYNQIGYGKGQIEQSQIGEQYLRAAGPGAEEKVATQFRTQLLDMGREIGLEIGNQLKGVQTTVAVDGKNIATAAKNSRYHRGRVAH